MGQQQILLVDDDVGTIRTMSRLLDKLGQIRFATSGEDALRMIKEAPPALLLLDAEMPGMSGFQLCERLKADPEIADVPVIFVTSHSEPDFEVAGFDLGAVDFIAKPISPPLLQARVKTQLRVKALSDEVRRISTVDALTEVANRRAFDDQLAREWRRTLRGSRPISRTSAGCGCRRAATWRLRSSAGSRRRTRRWECAGRAARPRPAPARGRPPAFRRHDRSGRGA